MLMVIFINDSLWDDKEKIEVINRAVETYVNSKQRATTKRKTKPCEFHGRNYYSRVSNKRKCMFMIIPSCTIIDSDHIFHFLFLFFLFDNIMCCVYTSGVQAIFFAFLLKQGKKQKNSALFQIEIWETLVKFMETGDRQTLLSMMKNREAPERVVSYEWTEKLYCHCLQPDLGIKMDQCEQCHEWFHRECDSMIDSNHS